MSYEANSTSQHCQDEDDRDDDDEEEYEEADGDNRLLGFMFGNVDDSGDLDVDYLDEDAKEHLAALANKLGSSLTDIDLSVKSSRTFVDAFEQDYAKKAEDAVDYEDIDEQYEGPEIQAVTEEDYLLPKENYLPSKISASTSTSVFDDENYDEDDDDEPEKEHTAVDNNTEVQTTSISEEPVEVIAVQPHKENSVEENLPDDVQTICTTESENLVANPADCQKEDVDTLEEPSGAKSLTPLPILCIEDGTVILKFSEIFAIQEPLKKVEKRDRWYSYRKEKYRDLDINDIIEEDEEAFLKNPSQRFSYKVPAHIIQDDDATYEDDESEHADFKVVHGDGMLAPEAGGPRKHSCHCDLPMNEDLSLSDWNKPSSLDYYPLDQQEWENRIIWDNSPTSSDCDAESCEMSGPDSETLCRKPSDSVNALQSIQAETQMEQDEKDYDVILPSHLASVEPLGSRNSPRQLSLPEEGRHHPQLLRLESRFEMGNTNLSDGREDTTPEADAIRRFSKLSLQNKDIMEGLWLDKIIWEPNQSFVKPKLILDLQDKEMLFEILDNNDGNHLQLHAGSMIMTRSVKSTAGDPYELHSHGGQSVGRFNIANDNFYSNRKLSQQLKSHSKKRTAQSVKVLHSIPALKLQTMKTKLSNKDIANFHRPKALWYPHDYEMPLKEHGKLTTQGPMRIILKSLGGKVSKLHVDAEETVSSIKAKATKKLDFKPSEPVRIIYSGKELEDNKSLSEQDVRTNSLLHLVRTKIHPLPKAQKLPGENKSLRPPGAFKKKSDLSVKDGHVFLMEYCEERPLLLGNPGMGARLCTYYQKSSPGDQTGTFMRSGDNKLGNVLTLDPGDKSPFLGDIKAGCSQSCLETNMYRAPIFSHKVSSTDYLLVRSAKGKLSIRRIDRVDVVGQQEPHMEVMSPKSKDIQTYNMHRLLVFMYRTFRALQKRGLPPCIRANELSAQFPNVAEISLKKQLKQLHICDFQRGSWVMKHQFRIPLEEQLRRMITPEMVCTYESMLAGQYRLKRLGISMTSPAGISSAMNQLPDEAIALAAASHIERELQITPWNLSSNFVACTNQDRENIERLEITGVGDPSGRGLGFSYVRTAPKAPISNAMAKKKVAVNRGGTTVTGTDADLRRLSMEAAREVLLKFNVPDEQIAKLTRWHRIAMIRKLSSEQAASGVKVDPTTISKYARGQRMSFLQLQQQTREKCQEIWDRQIQSLSAIEGEEMESDIEANSDLDSFAGDLENLLDAEDFEVGEEGDFQSNHDNAVGVKGLKMRRRPSQAQAEEQIEDEAAEAAELCKMLMDDEEAERKRKKKAKFVGDGEAPRPQLNYGLKNERVKKLNTVIKPIPGAIQPDGVSASKENVSGDSLEEEVFPNVNIWSTKLKSKKKDNIEHMGLFQKKVKILGDGITVVKEKKSARDSFVCGACGQLGHMRTNKNCPKYREDSVLQLESKDLDKFPAKAGPLDITSKSQQKTSVKKLIPKGTTKIAVIEVPEEEKSSLKAAKVLKVKCGAMDKPPEKATPTTSQISDMPATSDTETVNRSVVKVNKIKITRNPRHEDVPLELHKPSLVINPPMETEKSQPRKKIIIKRPKEVIDLDQVSQEESPVLEHRKTKKIAELSSFQRQRDPDGYHYDDMPSKKARDDRRLWEEENKRRIEERQREERAMRIYHEQQRKLEEQERVAEIRRFEESIRIEREEELLQKEKKKNKKNKEIDLSDDYYFDDVRPRRNDRRIPDRDHTTKRKSVPESDGRYSADYNVPVKRRRGGEVGLANILENIVTALKERTEVSYLFLKPVTKKDAADYHRIIKRPMDLSTIKEKIRRLEYKNRADFRHDVWQITFNAHKYNDGRNPGIPPLADQLLELCDYLLDLNDESLTEAEAGIDD